MKKATEDWLLSAQSDLLDQLYIDARYPGELGLLPHGKPTIVESQKFYLLAKQVYDTAYNVCI
jgi:hypothetical protein